MINKNNNKHRLEGKRNGNGKCTWPVGTTYIGDWKDDNLHGDGILTYSDGRVLNGSFANSCFLSPIPIHLTTL